MQITIKNYRGCASAELTLSPVALVAGTNHAGKSSIAQAVAAALTQNAAIIPGVTKSAAGQLLRDGEKRGQCKITTAEGSATVNWPGASASTDGTPPSATAMACGLVSLVDMKPAQAATTLIEVLRALPTRDDLAAALDGLPSAMLDAIWSRIEAEGWDGAHKRAIARGQEFKGAWEHVTGERYGSAKAADWKPAGFTEQEPVDVADLRQKLEAAVAANAGAEATARQRQELQAVIDRAPADAPDVAALEAQLEQAVANRAGDAGLRQRLEQQIAEADGVDISSATDAARRAMVDMNKVQAEIDTLPSPVTVRDPIECPHCHGPLEIVSRTDVRAAVQIDADEQQRRTDAIREASDRLHAAKLAYHSANDEADRLRSIIGRAESARDELAEMPTGTVTDDQIAALRSAVTSAREAALQVDAAAAAAEKLASLPTAEVIDIQPLREALSEAELSTYETDRVRQAAGYHQKILDNQRLIDELAPTGLRQRKLAECLGQLNVHLHELCSTAGWSSVEIGDDLSATLNGRPYGLLSESEKFRVRVAVQVVLAGYDGSDAVIIDAADILDRGGRNGLFKLLRRADVTALVCMTIDEPAKAPDLSAAKIGQSYWIQDGVLTAV